MSISSATVRVLIVEYPWIEVIETGEIGKWLVAGMLVSGCNGNLYKLSAGSNGAVITGQCFETKSRNELNFDIIKHYSE